MTRLLSFLRPCPLRVVTAEEIRAVAGASQSSREPVRAHAFWSLVFEGFAPGPMIQKVSRDELKWLYPASNSRRWR